MDGNGVSRVPEGSGRQGMVDRKLWQRHLWCLDVLQGSGTEMRCDVKRSRVFKFNVIVRVLFLLSWSPMYIGCLSDTNGPIITVFKPFSLFLWTVCRM